MARTVDELIKEWAQGAKGGAILHMTAPEVVDFAEKNNFDIREIRMAERWELVGWRLYETHLDPTDAEGKRRIPGELYYVVEKRECLY